ncbi:MAG: four-carbon acid sugar kinase family protein [Deltaproteobacteria bacterium]|nr:four-carbon acid sugar kinase family protein [Deltaproteobacteria bacterium]
MIETLIIADTLTGSADTGAKFSNNGPVKLVHLNGPDWAGVKGVVTVNTNTRAKDPLAIPETLAKVKTLLNDRKPKIMFKRIDSCLRGSIGLEISSFLKAFDELDFALVAPAHPEFGRITINGIHRIDDKPVHTTQYGKDPLTPVLDSRLKNILSQDHDLRVESIDLNEVRNGPEAIKQQLIGFLAKGKKFIVACDAEFDYDLDLLAKGTRDLAERILFSGSSGLASILADIFAVKNHNWLDDEFHPPTPSPPIVFFGGSYSKILRKQFEVLAKERNGEIHTVNVEALFNDLGQTIPLLPPGQPLILTLPDKGNDDGFKKKYPLSAINEKYGVLAADLVKNRQFNTIFLSGGDLAKATLKALDIHEIWIRSDLSHGVVFSSSGHLSILTKPADYGEPDTLSKLFEDLTAEDDW